MKIMMVGANSGFATIAKMLRNNEGNEEKEISIDSKLCITCHTRVQNELNGCYVCMTSFSARQMRNMEEGRYKEIATDHRNAMRRHESCRPIEQTDKLCANCHKRVKDVVTEESHGDAVKMKVVLQKSNSACIICGSESHLKQIDQQARIDVFVRTGFFIVQGSRCCEDHLQLLPSLSSGLMVIDRKIVINPNEVAAWLNALRAQINQPTKEKCDDIDRFTDDNFVALTSLTKSQFHSMFSFTEKYRDVDRSQCHRVDLLCFLAKMRQGLSDGYLKAQFEYSTVRCVSRAITRVRNSLMQLFVPTYLGLEAHNYDEFAEKHVSDFAQRLYNPNRAEKKAVILIDGTYCYIPKSACFRELRQTYSFKGRHLVKPIMYVSDTGRILKVQGPLFSDGKNNDSACLHKDLDAENGLRQWAKEGTIFVVDRGYRDVADRLKHLGYTVFMPSVMQKGNKQHTTEEANASRLVTKIRWKVEARNGHIKSIFKFFRDVIPKQHVKFIGDFFRIACAIINAYRKPITMITATSEMADLMLERASIPNVIQALVEQENLNRQRKEWLQLTSEFLPGFPKLTEAYLQELTFGVYQLKLAPSYTQDKIQDEGSYGFRIHLELPGLIRVNIKSRFSGSKTRNLWIAYDEPGMGDYNEDCAEGPIFGWYCDCPNGARTLGCCAHIASVLSYMGFARWHKKNHFPSNDLLHAIEDCANRPLPVISGSNLLPRPVTLVTQENLLPNDESTMDFELEQDDSYIEVLDDEVCDINGVEFEPEVFDPKGYVHPEWHDQLQD